MMIDLDHFKDVNDRYGHAMGDAVLRWIAQYLQANMRSYDRLYRCGGEEFLLCLPQTSVAVAVGLADSFRSGVAEQHIHDRTGDESIKITASFGVAALDATRPVEESIERADKAMYRAKTAGRNRTEIFEITNQDP